MRRPELLLVIGLGVALLAGGTAAARDIDYDPRRPQYDGRCETCAHCVPAQRGSRYDRACTLHEARVKTHGVCQQWQRRAASIHIQRRFFQLQLIEQDMHILQGRNATAFISRPGSIPYIPASQCCLVKTDIVYR